MSDSIHRDPRPTQHERFQNMKRGRDKFEGKEEETTSLPAQPTPPKRRHVVSGATAAERAVKMMFGRPSQYGVADDSSLDMKSLNSIHEIDSSSSDVAEADESSSQSSESSDDSESTEAAVDRAAGGRMSEDFWTPEETALLDRQARSLHKPASVLDYLKTSPLQSMLPDFLAKMEAANAELEAERAAGTLKQRELELGDEDGNENYIEMNLGLGVLEEKADTTDSSGDDSSDGSNILEKLKDVRRGKLDEAETKALIEEI